MPTKELIGANKITEIMLLPHLRRKNIAGRSVYESAKNEEQILFKTCGESISINEPVFLNPSDNRIYKADALANKPAFAFAASDGNPGETIPLINKGKITKDIIGTVAIGDFVYLRSNGNIGEIERYLAGDIIQLVGKKINDNEILIMGLENYFQIE